MAHEPKVFKKDFITVDFLADRLVRTVGITLEAVNDVPSDERQIVENSLHRPGLALAGYIDLFTYQRVQIIGNTENQYLDHLSLDDRKKAFQNLVQFPVPVVFLTENNKLHQEVVDLASANGIPIFRTPLPSTDFMTVLREFLTDQFAPQVSLHASMVDVYGVGMLLRGKAGIGKSEVALDLVERGHRLVADDVVILTKKDDQVLMAAGTELVQHFMEIRGLGLIDVRSMFGIRAIRFQKRAEVVVNMQLWDPDEEYSRLGMVDETISILGVDLPSVKLPITPGKNVTVLCEVIALNHLLKNYGYDPAVVFAERLEERIRTKKKSAYLRGIEYFEHDYE
ncbi:MAG: HPr(Ser) kinase/phosphatase [Rhodothermales bacterium]